MEKHLTTVSSPPPPPSTSPTTFVQADTNSFRDLVQKLTGFSGHSQKLPVAHLCKLSSSKPFPPPPTAPRRSPFKLQDRRRTLRKLDIKLARTARFDSPVQTPVTPLPAAEPLFFRRAGLASPLSPPVTAEDEAVAVGGFYLHPSPRNSLPPELLDLFPSGSPIEHSQIA